MHINSSDAMIFDEIIGQGQAWRELIPIVLDRKTSHRKILRGHRRSAIYRLRLKP